MPMSPRLLRPRASGDPDAGRYLAAVEAADGQALEPAVRLAIEAFIRGCKTDGIWQSIRASCILMGARTLSGALTPLVGAAPTNNNFVSTDYSRKTGPKGDVTTKWINTNRANNADPQNSHHIAAYVSEVPSSGLSGTANWFPAIISASSGSNGGSTILRNENNSSDYVLRSRTLNFNLVSGANAVGFVGVGRSTSSTVNFRAGGASTSASATSQAPTSETYALYRQQGAIVAGNNGRIAFYSIGEAIDLALLDARVSALYTAIGAATP